MIRAEVAAAAAAAAGFCALAFASSCRSPVLFLCLCSLMCSAPVGPDSRRAAGYWPTWMELGISFCSPGFLVLRVFLRAFLSGAPGSSPACSSSSRHPGEAPTGMSRSASATLSFPPVYSTVQHRNHLGPRSRQLKGVRGSTSRWENPTVLIIRGGPAGVIIKVKIKKKNQLNLQPSITPTVSRSSPGETRMRSATVFFELRAKEKTPGLLNNDTEQLTMKCDRRKSARKRRPKTKEREREREREHTRARSCCELLNLNDTNQANTTPAAAAPLGPPAARGSRRRGGGGCAWCPARG